MRPYLIFVIILLISIYPSVSKEIAYALGPDGEKPIGQANITNYNGTDKVSFTVSDATRGPSASYKAQRTVDSIKEEINKKVDRGNELVRDEGLDLVGRESGPQRISQICSIYDYMVGNWTFVGDWSGLEQFQYANYTLKKGNEVGSSGKGDCDDFSILLASLIESIGGTPRIIFAYSPSGGHAYTEVYLGKKDDKDLDRILRWLRSEYNANDINTHADPESDDVWLNMDWWKDSGGAKHPGGPFYQAATHIPVYIQEDISKAPLTPIENLPPNALFRYSPIQPKVEEMVSFNATQSKDPDGKIVNYEWDFGDGETANGIIKSVCRHSYSSRGKFPVNLTVTDNEGDRTTKTIEINVTEPLPEAIGTYSPVDPDVGQAITFDASQSKDRSGKIISYEWDFDDGYAGKKASVSHEYTDTGTYAVKLTVTNDKGAQNTSIINILIKPKEDSPISTKQVPTIETFMPDKSSPQNRGTTITWTVEAKDAENDPILYLFLLNGQTATDWQSQNQWSWTATEADIGDNQITVWIKDGNHDFVAGRFDNQKDQHFQIIEPLLTVQTSQNEGVYGESLVPLAGAGIQEAGPSPVMAASPDQLAPIEPQNQAPMIVELTSSPSGSQKAGAAIAFSVAAMEAVPNLIYYQFLLDGKPRTDWSENPTWTWDTTLDDVGSHRVEARIKDGRHNEGWDDSRSLECLVT